MIRGVNISLWGRLDAFLSRFQARERIAGLVVEETRLRFAEFRLISGKDPAAPKRVLVGEGAVSLPKGTIRQGALKDPAALTSAIRELREQGQPHALAAAKVVLSLPLVQVVGRMTALPPSVKEEERGEALRLEAERVLPFSFADAYFDWQELVFEGGGAARDEGSSLPPGALMTVAVPKREVDVFLGAVAAGGIDVVAVEPVTASMARGLTPRKGPAYLCMLYAEMLLAVFVDRAGNIRAFHHRSIPGDSGILEGASMSPPTPTFRKLRAEAIIAELLSFVRFMRSEGSGGAVSGSHELVLDGVIDDVAVQALSARAATLELMLRYEPRAHLLSQAAARGAGIRAALPRANDRFVSLTAVGTEERYRQLRSRFFFRFGFRIVTASLVLVCLLFGGAAAYLKTQERSQRLFAQQAEISPELHQALASAEGLNTALERASGVLPPVQIPETLFDALLSAAPAGIDLRQLRVTRESSVGIRVEIGGRASTFVAYTSFRETLRGRFTQDALTISPELLITKPNNYSFSHSFLLRADFR